MVFVPQVNPQASMSVSLAQTHFCKNKGYDPQSPLCAHIILSGSVQEVSNQNSCCIITYIIDELSFYMQKLILY